MHRTALLTLLLFAALAVAHSYLAHSRAGDARPAAPIVSNADDRDRQLLPNPAGEAPAATQAADIATPNHDTNHRDMIATGAVLAPDLPASADAAIVLAEPVATAPSIPAFIAADGTIYAKANARLRSAPSTASEVVAKLAANAQLHATGRSTDGLWWQVPLGDQRIAYIHRDAVTTSRAPIKLLPVETEPVAMAADRPAPMPVQRRQGPLDLVNNAIDWVVDAATHPKGPAPKAVRTER